jgi:hypothetical protein
VKCGKSYTLQNKTFKINTLRKHISAPPLGGKGGRKWNLPCAKSSPCPPRNALRRILPNGPLRRAGPTAGAEPVRPRCASTQPVTPLADPLSASLMTAFWLGRCAHRRIHHLSLVSRRSASRSRPRTLPQASAHRAPLHRRLALASSWSGRSTSLGSRPCPATMVAFVMIKHRAAWNAHLPLSATPSSDSPPPHFLQPLIAGGWGVMIDTSRTC